MLRRSSSGAEDRKRVWEPHRGSDFRRDLTEVGYNKYKLLFLLLLFVGFFAFGVAFFLVFILFCFVLFGTGIQPRALCLLDNHFTTELHPYLCTL